MHALAGGVGMSKLLFYSTGTTFSFYRAGDYFVELPVNLSQHQYYSLYHFV
jgi:hypothetical protein